MAEPAPKFQDDNIPGNEDSSPTTRPDLRIVRSGEDGSSPPASQNEEPEESPEAESSAPNLRGLEGGRQTSKPKRGHLRDVSSDESARLSERNNEGESLYRPNLNKQEKKEARRWLKQNRGKLVGGGIVGALVSIFGFFIFQGPLQFAHMAQLLEQFHFSTQENQSDDRFLKSARYLRYQTKGQAEKTRLSVLGNKIADKLEAKMNEVGIKSTYSDVFAFGDGYIIDPEKLSANSGLEEFRDKNSEQVKKYFEDKFNVGVSDKLPNGKVVPEGSFFVDASTLGYLDTNELNTAMLKAAKYNRITSSVSSRVMGKRMGVDWRPIKKLDRKVLKSVEARYTEWKKNKISEVKNGTDVALETSSSPGDPNNQQMADDARSTAEQANATIEDGKETGIKVASGDTEAISGFQDRLSVKIGLGAASATGVACMLRGIDQNADEIKMKQVVMPLVRIGMMFVTLGNETKAGGQDVDLEQMSFFAKQLNGKDASGQKTSWFQAQSIQAELGHPVNPNSKKGKPDETLTTITNHTPFHALNDGAVGQSMGFICSAPVQTGIVAVSFLGGPVTALVTTAIGAIAAGPLMNTAAHWLSGNAADLQPVGADLGNEANFGTFLAANAQGVSRGGRELSKDETKQLAQIQHDESDQEFQSKNIAYKLFNPYDARSVVSKVIDQQTDSPGQNMANMAGSVLHFGNIFSSFPKLLNAKANAYSPIYYDYGVPTVGFSKDEMNNPEVKNPFKNGEDVVNNILPAHPDFIDKASTCFGVTIDPTTFDIVDFQGGNPQYKDIMSNDCKDNDINWMKVRFYIFDTQNIESAACYEGEDDACGDVGFEELAPQSAASSPAGGGTPVSGNSQELAKKILSNNNISLDCYSTSVPQDVQAAADGKKGTAGAPVSSAILQLIATVGQDHKVCITAIESNGGGHAADSLHYSGDAVDFGNLDGQTLTGRNSGSLAIIQIAEGILPKGTGFGQQKDPATGAPCGPQATFKDGFTEFPDTCNHLHVQVPRGTP
jgi:hypothetical protein